MIKLQPRQINSYYKVRRTQPEKNYYSDSHIPAHVFKPNTLNHSHGSGEIVSHTTCAKDTRRSINAKAMLDRQLWSAYVDTVFVIRTPFSMWSEPSLGLHTTEMRRRPLVSYCCAQHHQRRDTLLLLRSNLMEASNKSITEGKSHHLVRCSDIVCSLLSLKMTSLTSSRVCAAAIIQMAFLPSALIDSDQTSWCLPKNVHRT